MLATLVIGLREGLEAALIVGIIAAFLRRSGKSLLAMWIGIGAAVAISLGVGVTLEVISAGLPQAQQEGMETIIGAVAVVMVTAMILWMAKNARSLKGDLEAHAASALKTGSTAALATMAFLAVLREGVETAVFLLAAFQSSVDPLSAGAGALIGVLISIVIGYGIYRGGVKLNMGRFFTITGVFLVLVAAGLVLKALRTAHEASWIMIGQDKTVDLSWLAPNGSAQAALLTGVLGIPADPRVIEVLGWLLYLVPMLLFVLWPAKRRIAPAKLPAFHRIIAISLGTAAVLLALITALLPTPQSSAAALNVVSAQNTVAGSLLLNGKTLSFTSPTGSRTDFQLADQPQELGEHLGVAAQRFSLQLPTEANQPATLSLKDLIALNAGRLPVGISTQSNPGPFQAHWINKNELTIWLANGKLLDASRESDAAVTLSDGGLSTARTVAFSQTRDNWQIDPSEAAAAATAAGSAQGSQQERQLWGVWLPVLFAAGALSFLGLSFRRRRQLSALEPEPISSTPVLETKLLVE